MGFLDDYEPVSDRIARFWETYPNGRIHTHIVERTETDIIIEAMIYTDRDDANYVTNDYAHEVIGSNNINKTSWLENCTTSAIGRALADLNFQAKKAGKTVRPSREEMTKATRNDKPQREWIQEATLLASEGASNALKILYQASVAENAPEAVREQIKAIAKEMAAKTNPDGQSRLEGVDATPPF